MKFIALAATALLVASHSGQTQRNIDEVVQDLEGEDHIRRDIAFESLHEMGQAAAPAVPALLCVLFTEIDTNSWSDFPGHSNVAVWAIGRIGEPAIPFLVRVLEEEPFAYVGRRWNGKQCRPEQRSLESEGDWDDWLNFTGFVGRSLAEIGPPSAVPLTEALTRSGAKGVWIADALRQLGPDAALATTALIDALQKSDPYQSIAFIKALGSIGPAAAIAVPDILNKFPSLSDVSRSDKGWVIYALGEMGPKAAASLPLLRSYLDDHELSEAARRAIIKITPLELAALTELAEKWRKSRDQNVLKHVYELFKKTYPLGLSLEDLEALLGPARNRGHDDVFFGGTARIWFRKDRFGNFRAGSESR